MRANLIAYLEPPFPPSLPTWTTTPFPWHLPHTRDGLPFFAPDPLQVLQVSRWLMRT